MPFAGIWRLSESSLERRYPGDGRNERKRVGGVARCPTEPLGVERASQGHKVPI
jgi:hypothetical protein